MIIRGRWTFGGYASGAMSRQMPRGASESMPLTGRPLNAHAHPERRGRTSSGRRTQPCSTGAPAALSDTSRAPFVLRLVRHTFRLQRSLGFIALCDRCREPEVRQQADQHVPESFHTHP